MHALHLSCLRHLSLLAWLLPALALAQSLPLSPPPTQSTGPIQTASSAVPGTSEALIIGLDADMSAASAEAGEAIRRGIILAAQEINQAGGLLGRPLQLLVRDHHGNPSRGMDNIAAFARLDNLVAVMTGVQSVVALAELSLLHQHRIPLLVPWAAGTPIVHNSYRPNFVFRVSARDDYVGEFLVAQALGRGYQRPGLLLEQTAWGTSNEAALTAALHKRGLQPTGIQWIYRNAQDVTDALETLHAAGTDVLIMATNTLEAMAVVRSMAALPAARRVPIFAHWGSAAAGSRFPRQMQASLNSVELFFLQTFSFLDAPFPARAQKVVDAYCATFPNCQSARDIFAPPATAQAYELTHLLALAITQAGSLDRGAIREQLENLGSYEGLVRNYTPPFTPDNHDALDITDFRLARYDRDGTIIPLPREE
ncbi:MAG: ABC transporter substrate-binding protein [Candidatus Tectimicrobiota bacterium]